MLFAKPPLGVIGPAEELANLRDVHDLATELVRNHKSVAVGGVGVDELAPVQIGHGWPPTKFIKNICHC